MQHNTAIWNYNTISPLQADQLVNDFAYNMEVLKPQLIWQHRIVFEDKKLPRLHWDQYDRLTGDYDRRLQILPALTPIELLFLFPQSVDIKKLHQLTVVDQCEYLFTLLYKGQHSIKDLTLQSQPR